MKGKGEKRMVVEVEKDEVVKQLDCGHSAVQVDVVFFCVNRELKKNLEYDERLRA